MQSIEKYKQKIRTDSPTEKSFNHFLSFSLMGKKILEELQVFIDKQLTNLKPNIERYIDSLQPGLLNNLFRKVISDDSFIRTLTRTIEGRIKVPEPLPPLPAQHGKTPKYGVDFLTQKELDGIIKNITQAVQSGIKQLKPLQKGVDYFTKQEVNLIIEQVANVVMGKVTGEMIVSSINALEAKPDKQIHVSHIKGLQDKREGANLGGIHRGGGAASSGVEDLSSQIDGVTLSFTATHIPKILFKDGTPIIEGNGYSRVGLDITITGRPPQSTLFNSY